MASRHKPMIGGISEAALQRKSTAARLAKKKLLSDKFHPDASGLAPMALPISEEQREKLIRGEKATISAKSEGKPVHKVYLGSRNFGKILYHLSKGKGAVIELTQDEEAYNRKHGGSLFSDAYDYVKKKAAPIVSKAVSAAKKLVRPSLHAAASAVAPSFLQSPAHQLIDAAGEQFGFGLKKKVIPIRRSGRGIIPVGARR